MQTRNAKSVSQQNEGAAGVNWLLRTFAGALGEKSRMSAILKENTANYISLESLINVDFEKKYQLPVSSIPQKKIANNQENDHVSFN